MSWCTVLHCLIPPSLPLFLTLYHLVPDTMALVTCPYHPGQQTARLQTDMIMTDVTSPGLWPPCLTSSSSLFFRSSHSHGGGSGYSQGYDMTHDRQRQVEVPALEKENISRHKQVRVLALLSVCLLAATKRRFSLACQHVSQTRPFQDNCLLQSIS